LNDGKMLQPGDTLRQPELAATLKRIARNGAAEFYSGETARALVDDMSRLGGLITLDDLTKYQPKVRDVLRAKYDSNGHAWEVLTSPPPSSGGVAVIEALNMLQSVPLKGWDDVESVHMVAEVMRRVFADRAAYLADPDYSNVPVAGLTDPWLRPGSFRHHRSSARVVEQSYQGWESAHLRGCRGQRNHAADPCELWRRPATPPIFPSWMLPATPSPAPIRSTTATALMPPALQVFF